MKKLLCLILPLLLTLPALGQGLNWDIDSFDVDVNIRADGTIEVTETIVADFTRERHRGIYRNIPYSYRRHGTSFKLRIDVKSVVDEAGDAHPYTTSRKGGRLNIRIGDPNVWHTETMTYRITYHVQRAMLRFSTHDELYFNVTGTEWAVPIQRASCTVRLPDTVPTDELRATSFVGPYGSAAAGPDARIEGGTLVFETDEPLGMNEGLTIVVGLPGGHVEAADTTTKAMWLLEDNLILLLPFVTFGLLYLFWFLFGRDQGTAGSVMVQYDPPDGLSPVEVGTLIDEKVHTHDITASVFDLAIRGYLRIDAKRLDEDKPKPGQVKIYKVEDAPDDLQPFEKAIIKGLFWGKKDSVSVKELEETFYARIPKIKSDVHEALRKRHYVRQSLASARNTWMVFAVLFCIATAGVGAGILVNDVFAPVSTIIACVLTIPLFPIFAYRMPRKTAKGRRALEQVKGLEEYISRAAVDEIEHAARQQHFEKLLPYAIAFGHAEDWAEKFEGVYDQPPTWYQCSPGSAFTTWWLVSSMSHSLNCMDRAMVSMPRTSGDSFSSGGFGGGSSGFGGGGFSGGGFGGGGGGAW